MPRVPACDNPHSPGVACRPPPARRRTARPICPAATCGNGTTGRPRVLACCCVTRTEQHERHRSHAAPTRSQQSPEQRRAGRCGARLAGSCPAAPAGRMRHPRPAAATAGACRREYLVAGRPRNRRCRTRSDRTSRRPCRRSDGEVAPACAALLRSGLHPMVHQLRNTAMAGDQGRVVPAGE
ncbi:MAG: hypothetical protein AW07_03279 [Candidatus Accumulibacter sp. SK-11]|nr:MAG: hypothetical protein AW07_03279 [Candidatus Accumulibacter sp. SK-11]